MDTSKLADWIIEQTTDAVIFAGRDGSIVRWNEAASRLFGHGAPQAVGQGLDLIIPEHLRAAHWKGFDAAMESGATRLAGKPSITRAVHKSGAKLYVEMTFAVVKDDTGAVVGSVAVARDAGERVAAAKRSAGAQQN
jgi:PAS domain S-box-containing protein